MSKHQVFFSFEYDADCWRASQIRNMGKVDDSSTFSDNDWEEVKKKRDKEIEKWIDSQLALRSCLVVLIGASTSGRKWINYEIRKAYELNKGMLGIYIHNIADADGKQVKKGENPFSGFTIGKEKKPLTDYVTCFDSKSSDSKKAYNDIKDNIEDLIKDAISNKPPPELDASSSNDNCGAK